MARLLYSLTIICIFSTLVFAEKGKKGEPAPSVPPAELRCEKFSGTEASQIKMKLTDNCDLEKPFSFSLTENLVPSTTYCCTKK